MQDRAGQTLKSELLVQPHVHWAEACGLVERTSTFIEVPDVRDEASAACRASHLTYGFEQCRAHTTTSSIGDYGDLIQRHDDV
ncbi:hypothetical protein ADK74_16775 [Streptomyces decoyicus]|nr:hypothetical protein ADK74_16775 [Streptomyces decoyicus]